MTEQRLYTHSIVSYASLDEIRRLLDKAKAWAYIYHDKDKSDAHYHILITFSEKKSFSWIRKQVISSQNTFTEEIKGDVDDVLTYFTHVNYEDKHHYDKELIQYSNIDYWAKRIGKENTIQDEANEAFVDDLLSVNFSVEAMGRKYGRDFIKNFRSYQSFRDRALWERQRNTMKEGLDLESAKKVQYFKLTEDGELIPAFEDYIFKGRE